MNASTRLRATRKGTRKLKVSAGGRYRSWGDGGLSSIAVVPKPPPADDETERLIAEYEAHDKAVHAAKAYALIVMKKLSIDELRIRRSMLIRTRPRTRIGRIVEWFRGETILLINREHEWLRVGTHEITPAMVYEVLREAVRARRASIDTAIAHSEVDGE